MPDYTRLGSPDWSRDGRKIALDGWKSVCGERCSDAHVLIVNADGGSPRDMGPGAMPSWSPDDKQIAYTEYDPQRGIWVMNADGSNRRLLDGSGWGAQWSPRRNEIAYTVHDEKPDICVNDLAKEAGRTLLERRYQIIYWGLNWSPDGNWICFKARLPDGGYEIAAVHVQGESKGFQVILPHTATPEVDNACSAVAWGGDGKQILISMKRESDRMPQLYAFRFGSDDSARLFPGFPAPVASDDMAWSSDGKRVALTIAPTSQP